MRENPDSHETLPTTHHDAQTVALEPILQELLKQQILKYIPLEDLEFHCGLTNIRGLMDKLDRLLYSNPSLVTLIESTATEVEAGNLTIAEAVDNIGCLGKKHSDHSKDMALLVSIMAEWLAAQGKARWRREAAIDVIKFLAEDVNQLDAPPKVLPFVDGLVKWVAAESENSWLKTVTAQTIGALGRAIVLQKDTPEFASLLHMLTEWVLAPSEAKWVKDAAVQAISHLGSALTQLDRARVVPLVDVLTKSMMDQNENLQVRIAAAGAIGHLGSVLAQLDEVRVATVVDWLTERMMAQDEVRWFREAAIKSIGKLGCALVQWDRPRALLLVNLLTERVIDQNEVHWIRDAAIGAISHLGSALAQLDKARVAPLVDLLAEKMMDQNENLQVRIAATEAIGHLGSALTQLDEVRVALLVNLLIERMMAQNEVRWFREAAIQTISHLGCALVQWEDKKPRLIPLVNLLTERVIDQNEVHWFREAAIQALSKLHIAINAEVEFLSIYLMGVDGALREAIAEGLTHLVDTWLAQEEEPEQRIKQVRALIALWDNLFEIAERGSIKKLPECPKLMKLFVTLGSECCINVITDGLVSDAQQSKPTFSIAEYQHTALKNTLTAAKVLMHLKHDHQLTTKRAEALVDDTRLTMLGQLSEIGIFPMTVCVEMLIATKEQDLKKCVNAFKNKSTITPILHWIQTNALPLTQLNFDRWPLGGSHYVHDGWIQELAIVVQQIPTLHTLSLKDVGLNKENVRRLCQLLEHREMPLNMLTDESNNPKWKDNEYRRTAVKNLDDLKQAVARNLSRAMLLGYALPNTVDRDSLELCNDIKALEAKVTTLYTPLETYETTLNGQPLTLMNYCDADNLHEEGSTLVTHAPSQRLFAQLGIDENQAIDKLLQGVPWREETLQKLSADLTYFIMQPKHHDGSSGAMPLDEETQALLDRCETAYTQEVSVTLPSGNDVCVEAVPIKRLVEHINQCLDDGEYPERVQKGRIIEGITALNADVIQRLKLRPSIDALQAATHLDLAALEVAIKTYVRSEALITAYLQHIKNTHEVVHLGFEGVMAFLELQGAGLCVYDPIPVKAKECDYKEYKDRLTLVLQQAPDTSDGNVMYYLLKDPYAGYQRLWSHAFTNPDNAEIVHKEALQAVHVTIAGILREIIKCFTLNDSESLKAFNAACRSGKALTQLQLCHFKASGQGAKDEKAAKAQSLQAALDKIEDTSKEADLTPQQTFSALKQAVLDFLWLDSEKLKALSSMDHNDRSLVRSVAGSEVFITLAQQLFLISKRIREAEQTQQQSQFDRKATFNAAFDRYFEAHYVAAQTIYSGLFKKNVLTPLNYREKILHCVGEFVLSALVALPAYEAVVRAGKATLHSLQMLKEGVHAFEGAKHTMEFGDSVLENTPVGHALHGAYTQASRMVSRFLLGSTLATGEMIKNVQQTFASSEDFSRKKNQLRDLLFHRYQKQLEQVGMAEDMVVCGEALARHILDKIMLGLLIPDANALPVLPNDDFVEWCYLMISYIPIKNAPLIKVHGRTMTCDALFRQSGLVCMAVKRGLLKKHELLVSFHWDNFTATPGERYRRYAQGETFLYEARPEGIGYHLAGEEEVAHVNQLLQSSSHAEIDGSYVVGHGIINVIWNLPQESLNKLKNQFIDWIFEVVPIQMTEDRLNALERRVGVVELRIDTLEANSKQLWLKIEQLQKQVEVGELERAQLKEHNNQLEQQIKQLQEEKKQQSAPKLQASQAANDTTANKIASEHLSQSLDANADALSSPMTAQETAVTSSRKLDVNPDDMSQEGSNYAGAAPQQYSGNIARFFLPHPQPSERKYAILKPKKASSKKSRALEPSV